MIIQPRYQHLDAFVHCTVE